MNSQVLTNNSNTGRKLGHTSCTRTCKQSGDQFLPYTQKVMCLIPVPVYYQSFSVGVQIPIPSFIQIHSQILVLSFRGALTVVMVALIP